MRIVAGAPASTSHATPAAGAQAIASPPRPEVAGPRVAGWRSTLLVAGFVGGAVIYLLWPLFAQLQSDTYLLLYSGRYVAEHGVPHREVFALAAGGHVYANQQWLTGLLAYELWRVGGYLGLAAISLLVLAVGYALLAALMIRRGTSLVVAAVCGTLAVFGGLSLLFIRAQVFAVPLFVGLMWMCLDDHRHERPRRRLALLVPTLVVWANLHGSVVLGSAMACAYLAGRAGVCVRSGRRREAAAYIALAVGCALSTFATPYGVHILEYYRGLIGNHAIGVADIEWDSPILGSLAFYQFAVPLVLSAGLSIAAWRRGHRPAWPLAGALIITGACAWMAMRNNIWLEIVAAVVIADALTALTRGRIVATRSRMALLALGAAVLAMVGMTRLAMTSTARFQSRVSMAAMSATARYVAAQPCARILADGVSADALLWFDPSLVGRIGFDGELEVFPQHALIAWVYFQNHYSAGWLDAARGYDVLVGSAAVDPALAGALAHLPGTRTLASDAHGIAVIRGNCSAPRV